MRRSRRVESLRIASAVSEWHASTTESKDSASWPAALTRTPSGPRVTASTAVASRTCASVSAAIFKT